MPHIKRWLTRTELKAVHHDDLDSVLREAGLMSALEDGSLACSQCGRTVSRESLACLIRTTTGFAVICSDTECSGPALTVRRGSQE